MRLTQAGKIVVFGTVALYVIALMNDSAPVYVLGSGGVAVLLACYLLARGALRGVRATADAAGRALSAGSTARLNVRLENAAGAVRGPLQLELTAANRTLRLQPERVARVIGVLLPSEELSFSLSFPCRARGWHEVSAVDITAGDPLGLFAARLRVGDAAELLALPRADHLAATQAGGGGRQQQAGERTTRAGEGTEFHSVREYVPGDELRRVHWATTARLGRLAVREWEQTWSGAAAILLDLDRGAARGEGLDATTETVIYVGASLTRTALSAGGTCLLATRGDRRVAHPPERGESHERRILVDLADLQAEGAVRVDEFLRGEARSVPPASTVFVVTPSQDRRLVRAVADLRARAAEVHVVLVSGPAADPGDKERAAALRRHLQATGAAVIDVPCGEPAPRLTGLHARPWPRLAGAGGGAP